MDRNCTVGLFPIGVTIVVPVSGGDIGRPGIARGQVGGVVNNIMLVIIMVLGAVIIMMVR